MNKNRKSTVKKDQKFGILFNIPLNSTPKVQLLRQIRGKVARREQFLLFTPNPEIVLASIESAFYRNTLSKADFLIPDGTGIIMANKFLALPSVKNKLLKPFVYLIQGLGVGLSSVISLKKNNERNIPIKGRKLFEDIIALCNKKGWKVFFLGGEGSEAEDAAKSLKLSYRSLRVETNPGPKLNRQGEPVNEIEAKKETEVVSLINKFAPKIIFAAFGAPKGELWATRRIKTLNATGLMSVGGTFNYYAGNMPLPPKWMENSFEWLWRVVNEPKRLGRIIKAVFVFPFKVYIHKLKN